MDDHETRDRVLKEALAELAAAVPGPRYHQAADRWYKGLEDQPIDESGRIVPYKNNCLANHR